MEGLVVKKEHYRIIGVAIALVAVFFIGNLTSKGSVDGEKVTYNELISIIGDKETELETTESELESANSDLADIKSEYEDAQKSISEKLQIESEIQDLLKQRDDMNKLIGERESELIQLEASIKKKEGDPIELNAGYYTVGKDIPSGRYEAFPNGRAGHLFVTSKEGDRKVSDILGEEYLKSFIFNAAEGDELELKLPVKFVPVE